jgi:hypothetical protein
MDDPRQFGLELADRTVARMEDDGLSSEDAAILAANEIVQRADKMIAAGASRMRLTLGRRLSRSRMARASMSESGGYRSSQSFPGRNRNSLIAQRRAG